MSDVLKKEYVCISDDIFKQIIDELEKADLGDLSKDLVKNILLHHRHIMLGLLRGTIRGRDLEKHIKDLGKENDLLNPKKKEDLMDPLGEQSSTQNVNSEKPIQEPNVNRNDLIPNDPVPNDPVPSEPQNKTPNPYFGKIKPKKKRDKKKSSRKHKTTGKRGAESFLNPVIKRHGFDPLFLETNPCPCCQKEGKLHPLEPAVNILFSGVSPIEAQKHVVEKARCTSCGVTLAAPIPVEVENTVGRTLPSAVSQFAVQRFHFGFPHHRQESLTKYYEMPVSDSNQWSAVEAAAVEIEPLFEFLIRIAANAKWIGFDDVKSNVVACKKDIQAEMETAKKEQEKIFGMEANINPSHFRTGVQSSVFVATTLANQNIVLYFTGREHQGENKANLLEFRTNPEPIILMSDAAKKALMKNIKGFKNILETNCLEHLRIRIEKIKKNYPKECKYLLNQISLVYKNDKHCKDESLNDEARLEYHKKNSSTIMEEIKNFIEKEYKENPRAEPNGAYAKEVLDYAQNHWERLQGFLKYAGAQLDNNITERKTKTPVRYQDNSKKYLTLRGASVGDLYMSLIETAILNHLNPIEYLEFCVTYRKILQEDPELFLPWNYAETKKEMEMELKNRPRFRIVSQRGAYSATEESFAIH